MNFDFTTLKKQIYQIPKKWPIDLGDYKNTVYIAGSGRSGTTWLQEIINHKNDYRVIFEPFHVDYSRVLKDWNYRQYLRPDNHENKFIRPARIILNGNISNKWVNGKNHRLFSTKRIIKDIRTQFLLKWIKQNFPEIPIIMILRHPCAVVNSQMNQNWISLLDPHINQLFEQKNLVEDFLNPFVSVLPTLNNAFEKLIFLWCLENYVPLCQFKNDEILIVFYENLCGNFEYEIERIFSFLGEKYLPSVLKYEAKPSSQTTKKSAIVLGEDKISAWRRTITKNEIQAYIRIARKFGLEEIYRDSNNPLVRQNEILARISSIFA